MDNRKKLITIVAFAAILFIGIITAFIIHSAQPTVKQRTTTTSVDPVSGDTTITGNDAAVAGPDLTPNQPTYLGFSILVDRGLSISQVDIIKQALTSYSLNNKSIFQQVSLDPNTLTRVMPTTPDDLNTLTFTIVVNKKNSYFVKAESTTPDDMTTKLYKTDQTTLLFTQ